MQNDNDDDDTDDWLIDRTVSVDLLSCYLEFKYAMSILFTSVLFWPHPHSQQSLPGSWCLPATFWGNDGLGTII